MAHTAADVNGTSGAGSPPGWSFHGTDPVTVEPAAGLIVTVRVYAGAPVEAAQVDSNDEPVAVPAQVLNPGDELIVNTGVRIMLTPRGSGGAAVGFQWAGAERLEALRTYTGRRGQSPYGGER